MDDDYLTMKEAADLAGDVGPAVLYRAAAGGQLRTTIGPAGKRVTTRAWLQEYLATRAGGRKPTPWRVRIE